MIETVAVDERLTLDDYQAHIHLSEAVRSLRNEARALAPHFAGRTVWMVNSTARGGGVAEMMPRMITIFRELGVDVKWVVIGTDKADFFTLTKRLHNLIHGSGQPQLTAADRAVYEAVSRENADALRPLLGPRDVLVVHDPQPLGSGAILRRELNIPAVFRCHIGLDRSTPQTRAAWEFLKPHADVYDHAVFTAPEYVPDFLRERAGIIRPAIDPLGYKNRDLPATRLMGILCNAGLVAAQHPVVPAGYAHAATRLAPDGSFAPASDGGGVGLLFRPIVTQISRWDRLKGFKPLLDAFVRLKSQADAAPAGSRHRRRLELVRLVLAGPDPAAVADDPEAQEVLRELTAAYVALPARVTGRRRPHLAADARPQGERADRQRAAALLDGRRPELAAGGFRSHCHRGHVEADSRARQPRLRHPPADSRRRRRPAARPRRRSRGRCRPPERATGGCGRALGAGPQCPAPRERGVSRLHAGSQLAHHAGGSRAARWRSGDRLIAAWAFRRRRLAGLSLPGAAQAASSGSAFGAMAKPVNPNAAATSGLSRLKKANGA